MRAKTALVTWSSGWILATLVGLAAAGEAAPHFSPSDQDLAAVAIVDGGQGVLLGTPARETSGLKCRFRFIDTSALAVPLSTPVLSASGTKLLLLGPDESTYVLDLTIRSRPTESIQHLDRRDPAIDGKGGRHAHRLPSQRFTVTRGGSTHVMDDLGAVLSEHPLARPGDSNGHSDADVKPLLDALEAEGPHADGVFGRQIGDWHLFRIAPDPELYVPVLEIVQKELVLPGPFETLERLGGSLGLGQSLFGRYVRQDIEERRRNCAIYYRIRSEPGVWTVEYWLYYPFDVGGLVSHLHDPEHVFVEVDKLGGFVRRVNGAAHGFLAGNNIYSTARPLAEPADLPLFVMVEFNKHATAPDINRDGVFTPGIDENEYRERAKVWGVRDVVGTNNNHLLPYDATMTLPRRQEDYLASVDVTERFPHERRLAGQACCRLIPLPVEPVRRTRCQEPTTECAIASVMLHPDFVNRTTILKDWVFPQSFLRATYGLGPGLGVHSAGLGYSVDLDRTPVLGRLLPLPGRVGVEAFGWKRESPEGGDVERPRPHLDGDGVGFGFRYEQFLSNLFGIHSGLRVYSPPFSDVWITFGPMVEIPLRDAGNVNLLAGLSLTPGGSPRFEMRVSAGFWKRRAASAGVPAGR
jgi:hypothetical protein